MIHARSVIISFSAILITAVLADNPASAGQVFVSDFGNDSNSGLTVFEPKRTAQGGIDAASPGDTIVFDTPGDFGTATINKPLSLNFVNRGQMDVPASGTPPANLLINTASGADTVYIRGLYMDLLNRNANAIQVNNGSLVLEDVTIENVGGNRAAVSFQPNTNAQIYIWNSSIRRALAGVLINGRDGADITGALDRVNILSGGTAVRSTAGAGTRHNVVVQGSTISGNTVGIQSSGAGSNIRVKNSNIFGNGTGLSHPNGGLITSLTGNSVTGNTANGSFTGTVNTQ